MKKKMSFCLVSFTSKERFPFLPSLTMEFRPHLVPILITLLISPAFSQAFIQLPSEFLGGSGDGDAVYCESWKFSVETNNAGTWTTVPARCKRFVTDYLEGGQYQSDAAVVAGYAIEFAEAVDIAGDGKDAWVFDVDEVLLSNLKYYKAHGYGTEPFDDPSFEEWVLKGSAPAIDASLRLYNELKRHRFKIFLITGRGEVQRNVTEKNLRAAGYTGWERLILGKDSDIGKPATIYKSEKRLELVKEGYRIHGSYSDQWSDLVGFAVAKRSFKLPNPMYYIP